MSPKKISKAELSTDLFVEVLEAAIHVLLCIRNVYPKEVFERRMLYGTPVYISRHPGLCQYIASVLFNMKTLLTKNAIEKIVVALYSEEHNQVVECYNFEVFDIGGKDGDYQEDEVIAGSHLNALEMQFRDLLLRMMSLDWQLPEPAENTYFRILVSTRGQEGPQYEGDVLSELQNGQWLQATAQESAGAVGGKVTPLRSVRTPGLEFQVYATGS